MVKKFKNSKHHRKIAKVPENIRKITEIPENTRKHRDMKNNWNIRRSANIDEKIQNPTEIYRRKSWN